MVRHSKEVGEVGKAFEVGLGKLEEAPEKLVVGLGKLEAGLGTD